MSEHNSHKRGHRLLFALVLVLLMGGVYFGTLGLLIGLLVNTGRLDPWIGRQAALYGASAMAALHALLLLNPTRRWLARTAARLAGQRTTDPNRALLDLARQIRAAQTLDTLLDIILAFIQEHLSPRFCAILLPPRL